MIAGVALIKINQVIQFLIIEKELIKYGQLNASSEATESWKFGDEVDISSRSSRLAIDYHKLTWENRVINLDTVTAPMGKILTGVRFGLINGIISLQIRANSFDYSTGRIYPGNVWLSSDATERKKLVLDRPDVSTKTTKKSERFNDSNLVVEFVATDMFKDAAQHTVPFFDNLVVEPQHVTPLAGVGLYYKGQPGYGGFIAPQLVVYDFEPYITTPEEF